MIRPDGYLAARGEALNVEAVSVEAVQAALRPAHLAFEVPAAVFQSTVVVQ